LPHEAWHTVQQKQGRVRPTVQMAGIDINDDTGLEKEADVMGGRAVAGFVQAVGQTARPDHLCGVTQSREFPDSKAARSGLMQDTKSPIVNPIQRVWEDSKMGVLKWDKLRDGVRWYFIEASSDMYFLIEGEPSLAHASFYKQNEGFLKKKSRAQWLAQNEFDQAEKFTLEDLAVADTSLGKPRLWKNSGVIFKSQNVDRHTQKPKGKDSTYVVGDEGMLRYKEDKNQYLPHPDRHICYVNGGDFKSTRTKAFKFKTKAEEKISLQKDSGDSVTVLLGNDETPMTVSLIPVLGYRVVDFDYDAVKQTGRHFHVGHPVK